MIFVAGLGATLILVVVALVIVLRNPPYTLVDFENEFRDEGWSFLGAAKKERPQGRELAPPSHFEIILMEWTKFLPIETVRAALHHNRLGIVIAITRDEKGRWSVPKGRSLFARAQTFNLVFDYLPETRRVCTNAETMSARVRLEGGTILIALDGVYFNDRKNGFKKLF